MIYPLFKDLMQDLKDELDLNEETFIEDEEIKSYFNEAVDMVQHQIHTLCEDYFLSRGEIPTTAGQSEFQLPSNIYANKVRKIQWIRDTSERYEVLPIRDLNTIPWIPEDDFYKYIFLNNGVSNVNALGTVIKIYPAIKATSTNSLIIWYIRTANKFEDENSACDIPEWSNVVKQYCRYKCMIKEGHPQSSQSKEDLDRMIQGMIEALRSRAMDENNKLSLDPRTLSDYNDFTNNDWYGWWY